MADKDKGLDEKKKEIDNLFDDIMPKGQQKGQKPESFHHFILENQYKEFEIAFRGYREQWDKDEEKWVLRKKSVHCFTDEEAEDMLQDAKIYLSSEIKLACFNNTNFNSMLANVYEQMRIQFREIAEYSYGRYKDKDTINKMKLENLRLFNAMFMRIFANMSRAIAGKENVMTHESVQGQESLRQTDDKKVGNSYI